MDETYEDYQLSSLMDRVEELTSDLSRVQRRLVESERQRDILTEQIVSATPLGEGFWGRAVGRLMNQLAMVRLERDGLVAEIRRRSEDATFEDLVP